MNTISDASRTFKSVLKGPPTFMGEGVGGWAGVVVEEWFGKFAELWYLLEGLFAAVSKPIFAFKFSSCSF